MKELKLENLYFGAAVGTVPSSAEGSNTDRADGVKILKYAMKLWSEAQTKVSHVRAHTRTESMDGATDKWFLKTVRREYKPKSFGLSLTQHETQETTRRLLRTTSFTDAFLRDKDDSVGNEMDPMAIAQDARVPALARLIDRTALGGIVAKAVEMTPETTLTGTDNTPSAEPMYSVRKKEIGYARLEEAGGTDLLADARIAAGQTTAFEVDDIFELIESIINLFQVRAIHSNICVTLTPALRTKLVKDTTFRNLEDTYMLGYKSGLRNDGVEYRGLTFVPAHFDVLPKLSTNNIATAGTAAEPILTVRSFADVEFNEDGTKGQDSAAADSFRGRTILDSISDRAKALNAAGNTGGTAAQQAAATRGTSGGVRRHDVKVKNQDMIYVWSPEALIFAERAELRLQRTSELPLYNYADQDWDMVNFGCMLIDEDYAIAIPLKGNLATQS